MWFSNSSANRRGVYYAHSMPESDVLHNEVAQQGRLAGAGFTDDVEVLALVNRSNAKRLRVTPVVSFPDCDGFVIHSAKTSHHSCHGEKPGLR
jgi:hypothetical protein